MSAVRRGGGTSTEATSSTVSATESGDAATETEVETTTERADATYPFGLSEEAFPYSTCDSAVAELAYRAQYTKLDAESGSQRWHRECDAADGVALGYWNRKGAGPSTRSIRSVGTCRGASKSIAGTRTG